MPAPQDPSARRARVMVVDDHPVVRGGILRLLAKQPDLECCGEAATAAQALELARQQKPDLAVIDLRLKQGDGLDLIKALGTEHPGIRILVLSQYTEPVYVERSLRAGALGFVDKEQEPAELLAAMRTVLAGQVYLSHGKATDLLHTLVGLPRKAPTVGVEQLTDRELVIVNLLGEGKSTKEIAARLGVSFKTVESHRENIKRKLNLQSAAELVHFATRWAAQPASVPPDALADELPPKPKPPPK